MHVGQFCRVLRYLKKAIEEDLLQKMVFVAGPRQVGKTTLAKALLAQSEGVYLSWDRAQDRKQMRAAIWPATPSLIVLDEIHKWRGWKRWIKGEFDALRAVHRFLVTGSAMLDVYRRGGDSLQGRYHHYRLHPLSVAEVMRYGQASQPVPLATPPTVTTFAQIPLDAPTRPDIVEHLMRHSGFPEPYFASSLRQVRRWSHERQERFFREDLRDTERVVELGQIELLASLLADRVTSLTSTNALREDLEVSHKTVSRWINVLERLYYCFAVYPFASSRIKGLKRMPKTYLWDLSSIEEEAARFENLVALHLFKFCHFLQDYEGERATLHFLRLRDGKEVDFLVAVAGKPWFAVEVKLREQRVDPALRYFQTRLQIPHVYQVVLHAEHCVQQDGVIVAPAHRFLAALV
ncbi:MAG: ATP-binding protein [Polyangiales bacterium]